jgi:hypothetical protein
MCVDGPRYRISHWAPEKSGTALRVSCRYCACSSLLIPVSRTMKVKEGTIVNSCRRRLLIFLIDHQNLLRKLRPSPIG